jgi:hypothetical protein
VYHEQVHHRLFFAAERPENVLSEHAAHDRCGGRELVRGNGGQVSVDIS